MRINKICQQRESCMNRSKSRYTIGNFDIKDYIKIIIISNIFLTVVKIICIPILQTMYLNIDDIQISIRFNFKNYGAKYYSSIILLPFFNVSSKQTTVFSLIIH